MPRFEAIEQSNDPFIAPGSQGQGRCRSAGNDGRCLPTTSAASAATYPRDGGMALRRRHRIYRGPGKILCRAGYANKEKEPLISPLFGIDFRPSAIAISWI